MQKRTTIKPTKLTNLIKPINQHSATDNQKELGGPLGYMAKNRQLLGWLNLFASMFLFYFTVSGFAGGLIYLPFGFGIMALYFLYAYVRNALKVDFGKITVPFNLVLLVSALICFLIGVITKQ